MGGKRQGMRSAPCVLVALCLLHVASSATDNPPRRHENAGAAPTTSVKKPPSELIYQQVLNKEYDIIVDVRSEAEFKKGHIRGALHMPGFSSATHLKGCENKKIGVYCWTGPDRATPTAQALAKVGFSSVFDLGGLQFMANMTVVTTTTISNTLPSCALKAKATQESHSSVIKVASHLVAAKVQAGAFDVIWTFAPPTSTTRGTSQVHFTSPARPLCGKPMVVKQSPLPSTAGLGLTVQLLWHKPSRMRDSPRYTI